MPTTSHNGSFNGVHVRHKVTTPPDEAITTIVNTSETVAHPPSRNAFLQFVCIVAVCIACYYNSSQCGLVFDDISAIRENKDLRPSVPLRNIFTNDFWGTPMRKEHSHKSYRPLTVLTFRLNFLLHELEPFGYHVWNVALHITVCLLYRRVCRLLVQQCSRGPGEALQRMAPATRCWWTDCSFLAALLFAVHPVHTEAVTGVVGRAELLSSIFFLLAFLAYSRAVDEGAASKPMPARQQRTRWLYLAGGFSGCLLVSMMSKEQGITVAGVCVAYEVFVVQQLRPIQLWHYFLAFFEERAERMRTSSPSAISKRAASRPGPGGAGGGSGGLVAVLTSPLVKRLAFIVTVTLSLLVLRMYVMGSQLPVFTRFDNPASAAETPSRQLTYSYLIFLNIWLLMFPSGLCCDWTMGTIPLIEGLSDCRNIATLATFLGLFLLGVRSCVTANLQQSRVILMSLAWLILPFVPASNLFFPVGFVVAERILYMPSMGFCLLVAYGYSTLERRCLPKCKIILRSMLVVVLLCQAVKTHQRNYDWRNEYTLFMSGVHVNPRNAKLFNNVGHALENQGRYEEALEYFRQATRIQEDDIGAHINVGRTYNNLKMFKQAEEAYMRAKALFPRIKPGESYQARIAPNHLNVFINLANLISKNTSRLEEADNLYRQAISMRADYVQAYINRGDILMKLNRSNEAQEVYERALHYDNENADIYYNLGVVFLEQGKLPQAHAYFNKAIELQPEHEQALLNSAIMLQEMGGGDQQRLSRERLYKVLAMDANNEKAHFNLGMLAMDEGKLEEAEMYFKRAIHLKEDFRSALFNLALLLADSSRPLEAVPYLNQLIRHHADHVKGLILLGDIYINHMKDLDAAENCYRKILHYDPQNIQGLHNLCVVFVERKRLLKAAYCLRYANYIAPHEDYIKRHFQIVRAELKRLAKLPADDPESVQAFGDYDPTEFRLPQKRGVAGSGDDDFERDEILDKS